MLTCSEYHRASVFIGLDQCGIDSDSFWVEVAKEVERGWDPPLAYLEGILKLVREGVIADLTANRLRDIGAAVEMFPGLPEMFMELDQVLANQPQLKDTGIKLEHYLVSGGIGDLLRGLKVAPHMTEVFGCEFDFDPESGKAVTVKSSASFTEKTKFIYAINKGITGERLRANPYSVNDVVPPEDRRIPFRNMIYVGDGPSDINKYLKNGYQNCELSL